MTTLDKIDARARAFSDARETLAAIVAEMNEGIEALKRAHLADLKRAVNRASEHEAKLRALIESAPELFVKPKSLVLHGIRIGYQKDKGSFEFDDAQAVCERIRRLLPDQADSLIRATYAPDKAALAALTAEDLTRIGVVWHEEGDKVFVRPADSEVDKLVDALLRGATEEEKA